MIRVLEHEDLTYGAKFYGLYGTLDDVRAWGKAGGADSLEEAIADGLLDDAQKEFRGRYLTLRRDATGELFRVMFVRRDAVTAHDRFLVASHEALHATFDIMRHVGMGLASESEEAFTYYHQRLTELMLSLMAPAPKRKRRPRRRH